MKALPTILTALILIGPCPAADEIDEAVSAIGLLPSQRSGQHITPQERNPFAVRPKEISKIVQSEETETQESRIRAIFKLIEVTGVRRDGQGRLMALAADLILREGEEVKPVMPDQTETLIVSKVGPEQVELTFIETKDSTQPRTIPLPVKNKVLVSQKLFGQPKGQRNFYTVTGKKALDPAAAAAAMASVQQVPGGAAAASSAWQSPPVSIVSAMAGLTGLFPRAPASEEERGIEAAAQAGAANPTAQLPPGPSTGTTGTTAAVGLAPVASPAAGSDSGATPAAAPATPTASAPAPAPAPAPAAPQVPPVVEPKLSVPVPAPAPAPPRAPLPAPPVPSAPTPGAPAAAVAPPPGMAAPPTYLRRHGEQPSAEPEARAARPAVPPPAPGAAPAVVE